MATAARRFEGRVCIVTGAGAPPGDGPVGIGRATAEAFAREGATVVVADVDAEAAERTVTACRATGAAAEPFIGDLGDPTVARELIGSTVERFGRLDVLDNNLGVILPSGSLLDVDDEGWRRMLDVNLLSMVAASRAAVPHLERTQGAIVNLTSIGALRPRGNSTYSVTKGAVIALTESLAVELGPRGIRVNAVAPGPVLTPMVGGATMPDEVRERRRAASVLGREGTAWDVAANVLHLASDDARYVTGVTLVVDGGAILRGPDR